VTLRAQLATIRRILAGLFAPQERGHSRYQAMLASSRCAQRPAAVAAARDASVSTRLLAASHASAASTSYHSRSPAAGAAFPTGCRSSRQTRSPSRRPGR
jgi:hypothetical protein